MRRGQVKEWPKWPADRSNAWHAHPGEIRPASRSCLNGLGFLYMNGQGVAQDDTRALGYFLIAAKRDFTAASTTPASDRLPS